MIRTDRLTDTFISLTAIDCPSFGERAMADRLTTELNKLGLCVEEDDAGIKTNGTAGNLFAVLPGTVDGEPLLFSGHMDTVQPAMHKKAQKHSDGTITSDGTTVLGADDAAGLAAILEALTSIKDDALPHRTLEILFTIAEEPYARGSEAFDYSKVKSHEAYVLDLAGTVGRAAYAAPTICSFTFEIFGKSSHAGFAPEEGVHAIAVAAQAISQLKMGRVDDETTLNIGTIEGGSATNIVPDHCIVKGEIRSYTHATVERVLESLVSKFNSTAASYGATCQMNSHFGCRAYEIPRQHPVILRYEEACANTGVSMQLCKTFGGSDVNQFEQHGITGLVIANAMFGAHSCKEYTSVADLKKVAEITQQLMTSKTKHFEED
jgi:tripeptide aminopeptidase